MSLTQDEQKAALKKLEALNALDPCAACGSEDFHIPPTVLSVAASRGVFLNSPFVGCISVVCRKCACIRLHVAGKLGINVKRGEK